MDRRDTIGERIAADEKPEGEVLPNEIEIRYEGERVGSGWGERCWTVYHNGRGTSMGFRYRSDAVAHAMSLASKPTGRAAAFMAKYAPKA